MNKLKLIAALGVFAATTSMTLWGGVITSPVTVVSNSGGEATPGDVAHIIDGSGLTPGFTSGVTDFDTYIAGDPRHTITYLGFEWFGANGVLSSQIVLDMGSTMSLARVAFWNDEFSGTSRLTVFSCSDAACTTSVGLGGFDPINNPAGGVGGTYGAEVFDITDASTRYVMLEVVGPQPDDQGWTAPSIGEVAFDVGDGSPVPEPSSFALLLTALPIGYLARRRRS